MALISHTEGISPRDSCRQQGKILLGPSSRDVFVMSTNQTLLVLLERFPLLSARVLLLSAGLLLLLQQLLRVALLALLRRGGMDEGWFGADGAGGNRAGGSRRSLEYSKHD